MQKTTIILHDISFDSNSGRIPTQVGIFGATSFDWISLSIKGRFSLFTKQQTRSEQIFKKIGFPRHKSGQYSFSSP